jgi:hypothetical protein
MRYPISDIRNLIQENSGSRLRSSPVKKRILGSNPADVTTIFWISDIGIESDVDIGTLPISE